VYSRTKTRLELDTPDYEETQGEDLPVDLFVCGMKLTIVHGNQKEGRMTMGVMMKMDVVDRGRELGMGASVFLE
jgi:hypothetical protein